MKKNMILGGIACALAAGAVFATSAPETAYIRSKLSASETQFTCRATTVSCENNVPNACKIRVNTTINGGSKIVNGERFSNDLFSPVLTGGELLTQALCVFYDIQ